MTLPIEKLRHETAGCNNVIHFNNAGAALPPTAVVNAMKFHIDLEASIGSYEAAQIALSKVENIYYIAAQLIGCDRDEIAFTDSATRAWDMAFYSLKLQKGDRILTSASEYASNYLAFLHRAKHTGAHIEVIRNDEHGQLDIRELQKKIDSKVKLIAMTHIPTQSGLINPAAAVGKIAQSKKIPYLLDATQSVGQMPINVQEIGCDFLCATGRKYLRGPRGTGFLFVKKKMIEACDPPFIDLHSAKWTSDNDYTLRTDARRFETWEQNIAGKIGLGVAIEYALQLGLLFIWERIQLLSVLFREKLAKISSIQVQDPGEKKCGIVTFTSKKLSAEVIQQKLAMNNINVSVSLLEYSRLDMERRKLASLVRASIHYYNTEEEIERFCEILTSIVSGDGHV